MNKNIFLKSLLMFSIFATAGANATTFNLNVLTPSTVAPIFNGNATSGSFTDDWSFSVSAPASASAMSTSSTIPLIWGTTITQFDLLDSSLNTLTSGSIVSAPGLGGTIGYQGSLSYASLTPSSTYTLRISGTKDTFGGIYSGFINVTAIPEPEEWAMFLLGLGLIAMRLTGSRSSSQSAGMPIFA